MPTWRAAVSTIAHCSSQSSLEIGAMGAGTCSQHQPGLAHGAATRHWVGMGAEVTDRLARS